MKGKETFEEVLQDVTKLAPNCYVTKKSEKVFRLRALNSQGFKELSEVYLYIENDDLNHYDGDMDLDRGVFEITVKGQGGGQQSDRSNSGQSPDRR